MFKLRTNSNQDHSTTYNLAKPFFSWGSAEELFLFNKNGLCMCQGQNNTDGPASTLLYIIFYRAMLLRLPIMRHWHVAMRPFPTTMLPCRI